MFITGRSHYVTSLSSSRRKTTAGSSVTPTNGNAGGGGSGTASSDDLPVASGSGSGLGSGPAPTLNAGMGNGSGLADGLGKNEEDGMDGGDKKRFKRRKPSPSPRILSCSLTPQLGLTSDDFSQATQTERLASLLAYLFSAHPVVGLTGKWRDPTRTEMTDGMPYSPTFWDRPSLAHQKLNTDEARRE